MTRFFFFFLGGGGVMRGDRIKIPLNAGHHRPASKTSFEWRFTDRPMKAQH